MFSRPALETLSTQRGKLFLCGSREASESKKIFHALPEAGERNIIMSTTDNPRIFTPQCTTLQPVEVVHENPWFSVLNRGGYYTVEPHQLQVIVLPVVAEQRIVMVRVKRPVMADVLLELPAGAVQKQETPVQAAVRELAEETGIVVNDPERFEALPPVCVNPNRNPLLANTFRVNLSLQEYESRNGSDDEIAEVVLLDYAQVVEQMCAGEFFVTTPMAVIARHLLGRMNDGNKNQNFSDSL